MDVTLILLLFVFLVVIPTLCIVAFLLYKSTFKNTTFIARQTGKDPTDVIWIEDKFRVNYENGAWIIQFYKIREKTPSVSGSLWMKVLSKKSQKKILKYDKEEFDTLELRKHIKRGLFFYEASEGEFYPLTIKLDDKGKPSFTPLSQDNKMFLINDTIEANNLTKNNKKELTAIIAIIVGVIVLGAVFGIGSYYTNSQHDKNVQATAQVCSSYAIAVANWTQTQLSNGNPQYLNNVPKMPGG